MNNRIYEIIIICYYWLVTYTILAAVNAGVYAGLAESILVTAALVAGLRVRLRIHRGLWMAVGPLLVPAIFSLEILFRLGILFSPTGLWFFALGIFLGGLGIYFLSVESFSARLVDFLASITYLPSLCVMISWLMGLRGMGVYVLSYPLTTLSLLLGLEAPGAMPRNGPGRITVLGGAGLRDALVLFPVITPPISYVLFLVLVG